MVSVDNEARQEEIHAKCRAICASAVDGSYSELFEPEFHDWIEPMLDEVEVSKDGKLRLHLRYVIESDEDAVAFLRSRGLECTVEEIEFLRSSI